MSPKRRTDLVTVALPCAWPPGGEAPASFLRQLDALARDGRVARLLLLHGGAPPDLPAAPAPAGGLRLIEMRSWFSGAAVGRLLESAETDIVLLVPRAGEVEVEPRGVEQFLAAAAVTGAGLLYSNFRVVRGDEVTEQHLLDYRPGSFRESFDFGDVLYISRAAARKALGRHGAVDPALRWAGLYDLCLKLATDAPVLRIPEPLYTRRPPEAPAAAPSAAAKPFDYGDADSPPFHAELEAVAAAHLRRLGAYVGPATAPLPAPAGEFPVVASIIMAVRDRARTIAAAVESGLSQSAPFPYNFIVVDDHSADGTGEFLRETAGRDPRIVHRRPGRTGLGIGGLLNEAVYAPECGVYAVQLDSDDLLSGPDVLAKMVGKFWEGAEADADLLLRAAPPHYALVIGSYTTVDFDLKEIPPGVVHHPEFTPEEGRNTALRMDGLGAPRAYYVPVLRRFGFPNVSYGEDYAVGLRVGRDYGIGRIYESLYLRRTWEGNTERSLPIGSVRSLNVQEMLPPGVENPAAFVASIRPLLMPMLAASRNGYNAYKDWLRTVEIQARKRQRRRTTPPA